jgi:hypothetical protein
MCKNEKLPHKKSLGPKERNVKENMKDLSHLLMSSYKPKVGAQG